MKDEVFNKVEKKTNVDKATILELAKQVSDNGLKDEKTLKSVINKLSVMTGKNVSKEIDRKSVV